MATVLRSVWGTTWARSIPSGSRPALASRIERHRRRTFAGLSGVPCLVWNTVRLGSSSPVVASRSRRTATAKLGDGAPVLRVLRVRLSDEALTADVDDGAGDRHRRLLDIQIDVAAPDRERLTETRRGAEHDLEDLRGLSIGWRTGEPGLMSR